MAVKMLNVYELKRSFSKYLKEIRKGRSFVIALRNRPVAELRPLPRTERRDLVFGVLRGRFEIPHDFDEPVSTFETDFYGSK